MSHGVNHEVTCQLVNVAALHSGVSNSPKPQVWKNGRLFKVGRTMGLTDEKTSQEIG